MWRKIARFKTLLILSLAFFYCAILLRNVNEGARRSLKLRDDTDSTDHVAIAIGVTGVNPSTKELTAQISPLPQGALAQDEVAPSRRPEAVDKQCMSSARIRLSKG
jgi:inactivated superfamily I helicase